MQNICGHGTFSMMEFSMDKVSLQVKYRGWFRIQEFRQDDVK
jgi:hypothetical protein